MAPNIRIRLDYIDALRGIAAALVVFVHVYVVPLLDTNSILFHEIVDPGKMGVVLFFFISGMVIPFSLKDANGAIKRFAIVRFFRLYPAYWVSMIVYIAILMLAGHDVPSMKVILANITMVQAALRQPDVIGVYWTLFIEICFYVLCAIAGAFGVLQKPRFLEWAAFSALVVALLMGIARYYTQRKLPEALPAGLAVMFLGCLWRYATLENSEPAKRAVKRISVAFVVLLPVTFYMAYRLDMGNGETWNRYLISYALAIGAAMLLTTRFKINVRWLAQLGAISYSLYLLHAPMYDLVVDLIGGGPGWVNSICATGAGIAAAALCFRFIEMPCNRLGRRLSREQVIVVRS